MSESELCAEGQTSPQELDFSADPCGVFSALQSKAFSPLGSWKILRQRNDLSVRLARKFEIVTRLYTSVCAHEVQTSTTATLNGISCFLLRAD